MCVNKIKFDTKDDSKYTIEEVECMKIICDFTNQKYSIVNRINETATTCPDNITN